MWNRVLAVGILVLIGGSEGFSEDAVHIRSKYGNQFVTSSTLRWVSEQKGEHRDTAVEGSVERVLNEFGKNPEDTVDADEKQEPVIERKVYVCRARHNGIWLPGQLRYGKQVCLVSLHSHVYSYDKYEILENIEAGARLSWVRWDRFTGIPLGSVNGGESYIARRKGILDPEDKRKLGFEHLLGKVEVAKGFGGATSRLVVITPEEQEKEFEDGEVLVETEPIRYELTMIKYNLERKQVVLVEKILGTTMLKNENPYPATIDTMMAYEANYSLYWGQGKAILKGLPTIIRRQNGSLLEEIKWGIQEFDERKDVYKVEVHLQPETAVNVTLVAKDTESETPYTAKLVAVYDDGGHRARTIQGIRREIAMLDVKPLFSAAFFIGNMSLVPTTTTTTTSTTTTTTTSTTTTRTTTTEDGPKKGGQQEGAKGENSSMMNDESAGELKRQEKVLSQSPGQGSTGTNLQSGYICAIFIVSGFNLLFRIIHF